MNQSSDLIAQINRSMNVLEQTQITETMEPIERNSSNGEYAFVKISIEPQSGLQCAPKYAISGVSHGGMELRLRLTRMLT